MELHDAGQRLLDARLTRRSFTGSRLTPSGFEITRAVGELSGEGTFAVRKFLTHGLSSEGGSAPTQASGLGTRIPPP